MTKRAVAERRGLLVVFMSALPRLYTRDCSDLSTYDDIQITCQIFAHATPLPHIAKPKRNASTQLRRVKVMMCDRISPFVQHGKGFVAIFIRCVVSIQLLPEVEVEVSE